MIYNLSAKHEISSILRSMIPGERMEAYRSIDAAAEILAKREDKLRKESIFAGALIATVVFAIALVGYWVIRQPGKLPDLNGGGLDSSVMTANGHLYKGRDSLQRLVIPDPRRDISPDIQRAYDSERAEAWPDTAERRERP